MDLLGDTAADATQLTQPISNPVAVPQPVAPSTNGGDLLDLLGDLDMSATNAAGKNVSLVFMFLSDEVGSASSLPRWWKFPDILWNLTEFVKRKGISYGKQINMEILWK